VDTLAQHDAWWVQVRGKAYGPYSPAQMHGFVSEGRVRPSSLVGPSAEGPWSEARTHEGLMAHLRANRSLARKPANDGADNIWANVFVFAEIHSGAWTRFMAALEALGLFVELAPGFWLVRTQKSAGVMRNTLSQTLDQGDRFAVIDATRDRLAWYNLGPEVDVRIREVWNASPAKAAKKAG
jgi:hypothetical protein